MKMPVCFSSSLVLLTLSAQLACSSGPADVIDPDGDPGPTTPAPAASLHFLPGQWQVSARRAMADGSVDTLSGRSTIGESLNSRATKEVLTLGQPDGTLVTMESLMAQRGPTPAWVIARGEASEGTFDVLEGSFVAGAGSFTSRDDTRPDGGLTRVRFSEATNDAFKMVVEHSSDAGVTWIAAWDFAYTRGGGALPTGTASSACDTEEHHQFDFWLGNWNAFGTNGVLNGTNHIVSRLGGCIVEENWVQNPSGTSFNMYDVRSELWYQVWVDANGGVVMLQGTLTSPSMSMTGGSGGNPQRITWTPLDGGMVRQFGEAEQSPGSWVSLYDLTYKPR